MSAGSGSTNPNPGSRSNGSGAKGPNNKAKKLPSGGENGTGRPDAKKPMPASPASPAPSAGGGDDAKDGSGTGKVPPKGATKNAKATVVPGGSDGGGGHGDAKPNGGGGHDDDGNGSKTHPTDKADGNGATLSAKPKTPTKPSGRVKSPN